MVHKQRFIKLIYKMENFLLLNKDYLKNTDIRNLIKNLMSPELNL